MWKRVDELLARAPGPEALRYHRLHLLDARRRLALGQVLEPDRLHERDGALADVLAAPLVLERARSAWDGQLVLIKGPEVACDYPGAATRPFGDLDLVTEDAPAARRALIAAGFQEMGHPDLYENLHHLRPLRWPGTPLAVELHMRPMWPAGLEAPPVAELLRRAVPSRTVAGIDSLPAAEHALVLAAHGWADEPLARIGRLLDVAATAARAVPGDVDAIAREWGCMRMWRAVARAAGALLNDDRSGASAVWARHLQDARERTVTEAHLQHWIAPLWGLPAQRALGVAGRAVADDLRRNGRESWRAKSRRVRMALIDASLPRSEHERRLEQPRGGNA